MPGRANWDILDSGRKYCWDCMNLDIESAPAFRNHLNDVRLSTPAFLSPWQSSVVFQQWGTRAEFSAREMLAFAGSTWGCQHLWKESSFQAHHVNKQHPVCMRTKRDGQQVGSLRLPLGCHPGPPPGGEPSLPASQWAQHRALGNKQMTSCPRVMGQQQNSKAQENFATSAALQASQGRRAVPGPSAGLLPRRCQLCEAGANSVRAHGFVRADSDLSSQPEAGAARSGAELISNKAKARR